MVSFSYHQRTPSGAPRDTTDGWICRISIELDIQAYVFGWCPDLNPSHSISILNFFVAELLNFQLKLKDLKL
jgi:hypothetical protein